ncbi:hypothetical protein GCM10028819_06550 [Spirosoma humi]
MVNVDKILERLMGSKEFDPFNENYSPDKILEFFKNIKDDGNINVKNINTVGSTIYLNNIYLLLIKETEDSIRKAGLSYVDVQKFLIAFANRTNVVSHYKLLKYFKESYAKGSRINFEDMAGYKIITSNSEAELSSLHSQSIECINQAQRIISKCEYCPDSSMQENNVFGYYHKVFESGNYAYILKDVYEGAVWDGGFLLNDNRNYSITLRFYNATIQYLKRIGELRLQRVVAGQLAQIRDDVLIRSNLYQIYHNIKNGKYISVTDVIDGEIFTKIQPLQERIDSPFNNYLGYIAAMATFYPFLQSTDTKLSNFAGLTLNDVQILLSEISHILSEAIGIASVKYANVETIETDLKKHLFRVKKERLHSSLIKVTPFNAAQIDSFLHNFTLISTSTIDYWRTPIVSEEDYYIFLAEPLTSQNKIYLTDYILQMGSIKMVNRGADLEVFIKDNINELLKGKGYFYKILKQKKFKVSRNKTEEIDLVLITKHTVIIAEVKCVASVVDSRSSFNAKKQLKRGIEQVKRKTQFITENINVLADSFGEISDKDIFSIVITNIPNFTGLIYDDVPIIDIVALNNYFGMGELVIQSQNKIIRYYSNEEEFSKNIRKFLSRPPVVWSLKDRFRQYIKQITPDNFNLTIYAEVVEAVGDLIE